MKYEILEDILGGCVFAVLMLMFLAFMFMAG